MPTPAEIPPIKLLEVTNGYVPRLTSSKAPCAPSNKILLLASWRFLISAIIFPTKGFSFSACNKFFSNNSLGSISCDEKECLKIEL